MFRWSGSGSSLTEAAASGNEIHTNTYAIVAVASNHYTFAVATLYYLQTYRGSSSGSTYGLSGNPTYDSSGWMTNGIASNRYSFAALTRDGRIYAWGHSSYGGSGAPSGSGWAFVASTYYSFAALHTDGTVSAWGLSSYGGTSTLASSCCYSTVLGNLHAFAVIATSGNAYSWGYSASGGSGAPSGTTWQSLYATERAFAALSSSGAIAAWGNSQYGGTFPTVGAGGARSQTYGFVDIAATSYAFAARHSTHNGGGSLKCWGGYGASGCPTASGYQYVVGSQRAFAAAKALGQPSQIACWGESTYGGTGCPTCTNGCWMVKMIPTARAFAALSTSGRVTTWGYSSYGGSGGPTDSGHKDTSWDPDWSNIASTGRMFAAAKPMGTGYSVATLKLWGSSSFSYSHNYIKSRPKMTSWGCSPWSTANQGGDFYQRRLSEQTAASPPSAPHLLRPPHLESPPSPPRLESQGPGASAPYRASSSIDGAVDRRLDAATNTYTYSYEEARGEVSMGPEDLVWDKALGVQHANKDIGHAVWIRTINAAGLRSEPVPSRLVYFDLTAPDGANGDCAPLATANADHLYLVLLLSSPPRIDLALRPSTLATALAVVVRDTASICTVTNLCAGEGGTSIDELAAVDLDHRNHLNPMAKPVDVCCSWTAFSEPETQLRSPPYECAIQPILKDPPTHPPRGTSAALRSALPVALCRCAPIRLVKRITTAPRVHHHCP